MKYKNMFAISDCSNTMESNLKVCYIFIRIQLNTFAFVEYIFPPNLAKYDIVITSYDVLRSELDFSESHDYQHLRNNKRYFSQVSPLKSVHWWRICFDEAQLVEGTFTRVANMANSLSSKFRWAVTGTPIQKSVNDLFGLFYFIREDPFCHETIWNYGLYYPYCNGIYSTQIFLY